MLAVLALGIVSLPSHADWKDDYARGLEAVQGGQWADASRYMQDALKDNDKPAKRVRLYGQRWETYAPQHYAGLAAYKQGNCARAQQLWSSAANKSLVSGIDALSSVEANANKECDVRLAAGHEPAAPVTKQVASVPPQSAPPVVPVPLPARQPAKSTPKPAQPAEKSTATVASASERAPSATQLLRPVVEAYLAGSYGTVARLTSRDAADKGLRAQLQLFRAAAAYREAALTDDDKYMAAARQAVADARKSNPALRPDTTFFPPRFLAFYNGRQ